MFDSSIGFEKPSGIAADLRSELTFRSKSFFAFFRIVGPLDLATTLLSGVPTRPSDSFPLSVVGLPSFFFYSLISLLISYTCSR